jgi:phosphoenolpyruvate synthase/pyruvate phosphate dikinase
MEQSFETLRDKLGAGGEVLGRHDLVGAALGSVGAKAVTLARMGREGIPVPDFYVIASGALALHLADNGISWPSSEDVLTDPERLATLRRDIRAAPMPETIARHVLEAYDRLRSSSGHDTVAVRSSAGDEDSASASFAGQFSSILGVAGRVELLDAVKECWASSLSGRSLGYRASRGAPLGEAPSFGVIVQVQVFSQKAGVLFTVHPADPDGATSYIEANFGTGESVTGGLATPDGLAVSRSSAEVVEARIATKRRMTVISPASRGGRVVDVDDARTSCPVLTQPEIAEIVHTGLRIEELLGGPQDVEWAIDSGGLWILQSRPVTGPSWRKH